MAGYHSAKNFRETGKDTYDALINLEKVAAADRDMTMNQIKTIVELTATISNLKYQLQHATMRINTLSITKEPEPLTNRPPKWVNGKHIYDAVRYCWTHRYCVDINHNSVACRSNNGGHQYNVTRANNKRDNQYGKPRHGGQERIRETIRTIKTRKFPTIFA